MSVRIQDGVAEKTLEGCEYLIEAAEKVPLDKWTWCPAEGARHVLDLVQECGRVNARWAELLAKGEWVAWPQEEIARLIAENDTPEKAVAYLREATRAYAEVVRGLPEDKLAQTLRTPWAEAPIAIWTMHAHWHMSYHEGQINYIQTLYGDLEQY